VRGDYADDRSLAHYFRITKWIGRQILPIIPGAADDPEEADIKLRQAALLGLLLQRDTRLCEKWQELYDETAFLVGRPDSSTPLELIEVADKLLPAGYHQGLQPVLGESSALGPLRKEFAQDQYPRSAIVPVRQYNPGDAPRKYVQFLGE